MNRRNFITAMILAPLGSTARRVLAAARRIPLPILRVRVHFGDGWKTFEVVHDRNPSGRPWTRADMELAETRVETKREARR